MRILIRNCAVLDPDAPRGVREGQNIVIEDQRIAAVEPGAGEDASCEEVIEGRGLLAIPGLVNAHSHSPETIMKATSDRLPLEFWLARLFATCGAYTPREVYLACLVGAVEMLRTGTTAVVDHLWMAPAPSPELLDAAMQAYADVGIRAAVAPLIDDEDHVVRVAHASGFPLGETLLGRRRVPADADELLGLVEDFITRWHGRAEGRLQCFVGPSGIQWCSERLLATAAGLARRYRTGFHLHVLETRLQSYVCRERFGMPGVAYLQSIGVLGPNVSLAHAVWLDEEDLEAVAATGTRVVHNPASNLKLGSGIAPVRTMLDRGVTVALGTDGAASSDNHVLFDAIKLAGLVHNIRHPDPARWVSAREAVTMATEGGAAVLGLAGRLGRVAPGCLADIALLDMHTAVWTPVNDAFRQLAYCETGQSVRTVIVNGRVVMRDQVLTTLDEREVLAEARDVFSRRRAAVPDPTELARATDLLGRFREYVLARGGQPC